MTSDEASAAPPTPPTGEGDQQQPSPPDEPPVVPLPPVLTMGAASFTQQASQQRQQKQQQQQQPSGRGRGGGRGGRHGPSTPPPGRGRGRGGGGGPSTPGRGGGGGGGTLRSATPGRGPVMSIAPTTGIPFGHLPAYLPGSSSLVEELNTRILVVLRDGRHLVGMLRSFDQYSNMVMDEVSERKIHRSKEGIVYYADMFLGVYIARGDSMVLLGQVGNDEDMQQVEMDELEDMIAKTNQDELEWDFDKDLLA